MNTLVKLINKYSYIRIYHHINPDGDAHGSTYGLYNLIKDNFENKKIDLISQDNIRFNYVKYSPRLKQDSFINKDFLGIVVDTPTTTRVNGKSYKQAKELIVIDHHTSTLNKIEDLSIPTQTFINKKIPSTTLLITRFSQRFNWKISKKAAKYLLIGALTDTMNNASIAVRDGSLKEISFLSRLVDINKLAIEIFSKTQDDINLEKLILNEMIMSRKYNYIIIEAKDYEKLNSNWMKSSRGVSYMEGYNNPNIWVSITKNENNKYNVELRSNENYLVNEIALKFKGGGHKNASGCIIEKKEIPTLLKEVEKIANEKK